MPLKSPAYKIIFLWLFLLPLFAVAQTFRLEQYTTHNGLPIDNVYAAAQDSNGFIWFGTDFGIARFDGYRFTNYSKANGMANKAVTDIVYAGGDSLIFFSYPFTIQAIHYDGRINTLVENSHLSLQQLTKHNGEYYCYQRGVGKFALLEKGKYQLFDADSVFGIKGILINAIVTLEEKGIAFCTSKGLFIKEGSHIIQMLPNRQIQHLVYTKQKKMLAVSEGKLLESGFEFEFKPLPFSFPLGFTVYHIEEESNGAVWFRGIDKGVYRLLNSELQEMSERVRMQNKTIHEFFNDADGNFWFCTDGAGILLKKKSAFINYETNDGLANNKVLRLLKQNNELIIGTSNGLSIMQDKKIKTIDLPQNGIGLKYVSQLFQAGNDIIGICIEKTFAFNDNYDLFESQIKDFGLDNHRFRAFKTTFAWQQDEITSWILSSSSLSKLQKATGKKESFDLAPFKVRKGYSMIEYENKLWFGTDAGIIFIEGNKVTKKDSVGNEKLGQVFNFLKDKQNRLWIATDIGLFFYEYNKFTAIEKGSTLGINYCKAITIDGKGKIWAATWDGIFVTDGKTKKYYNTNDGLPSKTVNCILYDSAGRNIFVGTENGLAVLYDSVLTDAPVNAAVFINCSIAGYENNSLKNNSTLPPSQNSLGFYLSFPYYQSIGDITYEYKLDDGSWTPAARPTIIISDIGSGKHSFYARAKVNGEPVAKDAEPFIFTVEKPFYKSWWFWLIPVLILQLIIYKVVNHYNKKEREKKLATQSQQAEYASLKQQAFTLLMNPHFIFNALNSVQYYVNRQDRQTANKYLSDFATLIRRSFDASQKSFVTLDEELETIRLYLQLEKMRFTDKFEYTITVSKETADDDWMLPSMMLQPFLENAVLHGLMPLSEKGLLTIDASAAGNSLYITITDTGIGIEKSKALRSGGKHNSKGMQLIKERIELLSKLGKEPIELTITELNPGAINPGTKIILVIPQELYDVYQQQRNPS